MASKDAHFIAAIAIVSFNFKFHIKYLTDDDNKCTVCDGDYKGDEEIARQWIGCNLCK